MNDLDQNIAEYEALEARTAGIFHQELRYRTQELLSEAATYATVVTAHRNPSAAAFEDSILPSARDVGHAQMKLNFMRAKRYIKESNLFKIDLTHDHDRKLVNELIAAHEVIFDRVTLVNLPPELHTQVRNSLVAGNMDAIPLLPTIQRFARRARATISNTFYPTTH